MLLHEYCAYMQLYVNNKQTSTHNYVIGYPGVHGKFSTFYIIVNTLWQRLF